MKKRRRSLLITLLLSVLISLSGCSKNPIVHAPGQPDQQTSIQQLSAQKSIEQFYLSWQGTPYRMGGLSRSGIDCSGFVLLAYEDIFGLNLPRTTKAQSRYGKKVDKDNLRTGDLVFFNTGLFQDHVGIYWKNGRFIHASTSKGVMASSLSNPYWRRTYDMATRPPRAYSATAAHSLTLSE